MMQACVECVATGQKKNPRGHRQEEETNRRGEIKTAVHEGTALDGITPNIQRISRVADLTSHPM